MVGVYMYGKQNYRFGGGVRNQLENPAFPTMEKAG
jgi:hypothetical protein